MFYSYINTYYIKYPLILYLPSLCKSAHYQPNFLPSISILSEIYHPGCYVFLCILYLLFLSTFYIYPLNLNTHITILNIYLQSPLLTQSNIYFYNTTYDTAPIYRPLAKYLYVGTQNYHLVWIPIH